MSVDQKSSPRKVPPWNRLLIDEDTLAELLGVSRPTARRWVEIGLISPVELPLGVKRTLYRRTDIEAAVEALPLFDHEGRG